MSEGEQCSSYSEIPLANKNEEIMKINRKILIELSLKKPILMITKLIELIVLYEKIDSIQNFLTYLQLLNDILLGMDKSKISIVEEELTLVLKNSINNSIKFIEFPNLPQNVINNIYERRSMILNTLNALIKLYPKKTIDLLIELIDPSIPLDSYIIVLILNISTNHAKIIFPKINEIISKILPSFSSIKADNIKIEFANLLAALCDNLILGLENNQNFNYEQISQMIASIFDIIYNQWMQSKESKVRSSCLHSLGYLFNFLSAEKIKNFIEPLTQLFSNAFKKENKNDHLKIAEGFNKFLEKILQTDKSFLDTLTKSLVISMHGLFLSPIFSSNYKFDPIVLKIKNELLTSIQLLSKFNSDHIFDHFIGRLTCKEKMEKVCSMWILILLISREGKNISENLKKTLLTNLQNIVYEADFEIRFVLCELTLTILQTDSFKNPDDILFLTFFLIKQTAIHDDEIKEKKNQKSEPFETTLESLKFRSQQILFIVSNDIKAISTYLWPYILEFVVNSAFSPGLAYICKIIGISIKKYVENYGFYPKIDYNKNSNCPKSQTLIIRLIILLHKPHIFKNLGKEILNVLPLLLPVLDHDFSNFSSDLCSEIDLLITSNETDVILLENTLLSNKIDILFNQIILCKLKDKEWISDLNESLLNSYKTYSSSVELTGALCKMNGIVLSNSEKIEQIKYGMEKIFTIIHNEYSNNMINAAVPQNDPPPLLRICLGEAFGYISRNYFDVTIEKVRQIFNADIIGKKQSSGLVSFFIKGIAGEETNFSIKITLVLILGFVAKHADPLILTTKIEGCIINNILPFMDKASNYNLKLSCQKSILMISEALEKIFLSNNNKIDEESKINLNKHKEKLMEKSQQNFSLEKMSELKILAFNTICSLMRLDSTYEYEKFIILFNEGLDLIPSKLDEKNLEVFKTPLREIFETLIFHDYIFKEIANSNEKNIVKISFWENLHYCLIRIMEKTNQIADDKKNIFLKLIFEQLITAVEKKKMLINSKNERKIALKVMINIISHIYIENRLIKDSLSLILKCITISFNFTESIINQIDCENNSVFILKMFSIFSDQLNLEELIILCEETIEIMTKTKIIAIFNGCSLFINLLFQTYEKLFQDNFKRIIPLIFKLYDTIEKNDQEENRDKLEEICEIIKKLLTNNLIEILEIFLENKPQIPLHCCVSHSIIAISKNKSLVLKSFNHLTDVMNNPEHIIAENIGAKIMNATLFVGTIMEQKDEIVVALSKKYFPQMFSTFLIRISTSYDEKFVMNFKGNRAEDDPSKQTLWSFKKFLECADNKSILNALESGINEKFLYHNFDDGLVELIILFCRNSTLDEIKYVYEFLDPFLAKKIDSQKLICIVFISQLISSIINLKQILNKENYENLFDWIQNLIDTLINNINDKYPLIRKHCLKGLGNISLLLKYDFICSDKNPSEQNEKENVINFPLDSEKTSIILVSLFNGMEDSHEICAREALFSLQRLIDLLDMNIIKPNFLNLLSRLPDNFERNDPLGRMGAFNLFGKIANRIEINDDHYNDILTHIHYNLISLILHINDENSAVKQSCLNSLSSVSKLLNLDELWNLIENYHEFNYPENSIFDKNENFLIKTFEILHSHFEEKRELYTSCLLAFCDSPDDHIRSIAGLILCFCLKDTLIKSIKISSEIIFKKISMLMEDKSILVKTKLIKGLLLMG